MLMRSKNNPMEISISSIVANPGQPRKVFPDQELDELCNSIREFGVIQPIIVKKSGSQYILIAGERRVRASTLAGLEKIPAVIRDADEKDMAFIALIENVQRENLNYIEEAMAYKHFMDEYGMTQCEISKRVGKQQCTISNKIRLLSLPEEMREALTKNQLTERHARAILRITDGEQRKQILERIIDHSLNVRQSEKLIDDFLKKTEDERRKAEKLRFINYRIYINTIKNAFNSIHEVEEGAKYYQEDKGDHLELRILIPKKAG